MAQAIDEVTDYLIAENVVTAMGTDLFQNYLPDDPDAALLVRETGGSPGEKGLGVVGLQFEHPAFQFLARGAADDPDTPRALCQAAKVAIAKIEATTLGSTLYLLANILQEPFSLKQDEKQRWSFVFNAVLDKEPS